MYLSKAQILASVDRRFDEVPVPEWGGKVRIAEMSALERSRFEVEAYAGVAEGKPVDMARYRIHLAVHSIVDENGAAVFTAEDVEALGAKSYAALDRVSQAAAKLNGLMKEGAKAAEGNSEGVQADAASSE